ncbi:MAG: excinuclease ABC subunit UvrA [Bacteroidales bacterium]|nr:excinuclease ABC subunit UvrA [Bacteroidales bacterium]
MKDNNSEYILIENANEHNLKNVNVKIPHHEITCFTGVSGSGKSSLVYDIIGKESQRRYFETFSSYARQFVGKMSRPEVDRIEGLMPAITVDQKTGSRNPRSTVGTMSELYDYLRLLFARIGVSENMNLKFSRSLFSFNSPEGYCPHCKGLGVEDKIDPELLIFDESKSLREGALKITTPSGYTIYSQVTIDVMDQVCNSEGFNVDIAWKDLTEDQKIIVLNGSDKIKIPYGKHTLESRMKWSGITAKPREEGFYKGILPVMENILRVDRNPNILRFARTVECSSCKGKRLNSNALSVEVDSKSIIDFSELTIRELREVFQKIEFKDSLKDVGNTICEKILERCSILEELGLSYLTLMRESTNLSGGEAQRIRLASQVGNGLRGILYILDEPSIGLHPRDNKRMIRIMKRLRDQGNTVLVVEHDKETILNSDRVIDIGPLAGKKGGELMFNSEIEQISFLKNSKSETLRCLKKKPLKNVEHDILEDRRLRIRGANLHNLKNVNVDFRLHSLNLVTGVSGAGKSTLVFEILGKYYENKLAGNKITNSNFTEITSDTKIQKIIEIDQSPIGRTPRSNPATYTKVFDLIRKLFANLPESKENKWKQGYFSFNTVGGRCDNCEGAGFIQTGMHFLNNVETVCESCGGKRYKQETLKVKYKDKSISDILEMEISDAFDFFSEEPKIHHFLGIMKELGLGYLSLGQSATTLSGGEAQRLKLASELVKPTKEHTLYLFDEPTTGLHAYDIEILYSALRNLTINGHTVIVVEHDADIIEKADNIIDIGPEGGAFGGEIVFSGSYNDLLKCKNSFTAEALNENEVVVHSSESKNLKQIVNAPISLKGVSTHNLKGVDIDFPRNKLTVITGVSGSGKSSLAFDSLFAEGQFRFTESFSTYTRSLIQQKARPDIIESNGLTPTIAVDNKALTKNPRATVGTISGVYDLYRLLFSRIAKSSNNKICTEPTSLFSFNHQKGTCLLCNGLGFELTCDAEKLISNPKQPINKGAMKGSKPGQFYGDPFGQHMAILEAVAEKHSFDIEIPWNELLETSKKIILDGTGDVEYNVDWRYKRKNREGMHQFQAAWKGLIYYINDEYARKHDKQGSANLVALMKEVKCNSCGGSRLNNNALDYKINTKNIDQVSRLQADESLEFIKLLETNLNDTELQISAEIRRLLKDKLSAMKEIGLGYLSVSRSTMSLSGGEGRRLRLISQLGGELVGITYVLDEPTVGLHSKDTKSLIKLLKKLSNKNTVVVVEHDEEVIRSADYLVELGPGAGINGGEIIASGSQEKVLSDENAISSKYFKEDFKFDCHKYSGDLDFDISVVGARANNLKSFNINLPINGITVFSGVSGSGKTSLVFDVVGKSALSNRAINCDHISGVENFNSVIYMDQSPIGRNSLSTPLSYLNLYDQIRDLFSKTEISKELKFKSSHFSYNSKAGQCAVCKGQGHTKVAMDFLSDVSIICSECKGDRFKKEILKVRYNNYSIADVLNKTIFEAKEIFQSEKKLYEAFELLIEIGLGHLKLGQSATSLSGGEAQRLKLAKELIKNTKNKCLYLLDEPTTGLHFLDIEKLIRILLRLRDQGHALYIVEHHPWFYKIADFLIELGPEGGRNGGNVIK